MITRFAVLLTFSILSSIGVSNRLPAQVDVTDAQPMTCAKPINLSRIRRLGSVPARDSIEACRALSLAIVAANKKYPGRIDSAVVWRHDFLTLGTNSVESAYQVGLYIVPRPYVEVWVDRKTWAASVQFLEGRP